MEKIGFAGLGIMGKPMAGHLLKAGHPLFILSSSAAAATLKEEGAVVLETPAAMAKEADIIITMLPDSPEVESMVTGKGNLLQNMKPGSLFIDMSTISPAVAISLYKQFSEKGIEALDAPVSGGQTGAEAATLSIMVGGNEAAFQRALPVFEKMGKNIVHIGKPGAGQTAKACNQVVVGMTIQAVAEAMTLAKKSGIDIAKVRAALLGGFAQSRVLEVHGDRALKGTFTPGFKTHLYAKDMRNVVATLAEQNVPAPVTAIVQQLLHATMAAGHGEDDNSVMAKTVFELAGLE